MAKRISFFVLSGGTKHFLWHWGHLKYLRAEKKIFWNSYVSKFQIWYNNKIKNFVRLLFSLCRLETTWRCFPLRNHKLLTSCSNLLSVWDEILIDDLFVVMVLFEKDLYLYILKIEIDANLSEVNEDSTKYLLIWTMWYILSVQ